MLVSILYPKYNTITGHFIGTKMMATIKTNEIINSLMRGRDERSIEIVKRLQNARYYLVLLFSGLHATLCQKSGGNWAG